MLGAGCLVLRFADVNSEKLPRTLGLWSSVALVVGITIGSGIFRSSASVALYVPNPLFVVGLWTTGGLITLCGALSLAELAAALPETGGFYAYLREGWGPPAAFLFGWSELVLIRASAVGGIALVFGEYLLRSLGVNPIDHSFAARAVSAAAIILAAAVNIRGATLGALVVGIATWAKFAALVVLAAAAFLLGGSHGASWAHLSARTSGVIQPGALGLALVSILWAYDGWGDLTFVSGEVKDPRKTLPRAIILGTFTIIAIYIAINVAYLYVSPVESVGHSPLVAADTMSILLGGAGVALVSIFVMISSFSSLNGSMLAAPRVFFAMADDGLFFRGFAKVHPRYQTPYIAILLAAALGVALVFSRSFEALTNTFVLAVWPFYALAIAAIYRLRVRRPDLPRPYRTLGYPVVPAVFIGAVVWFVANALIYNPAPSLTTFAVILAGLPVYYVFFARDRVRFR